MSRKDCLPKNICNACLLKLEVLYEFWNTTANSEKTLITWLNEAGVDTTNVLDNNETIPEEIVLKQETVDVLEKVDHNAEDITTDTKGYVLEQHQSFETPNFEYQNEFNNVQVNMTNK